MKRAHVWALLCTLASAIGCATLPSVPEGTCGNLVVDANEDCEQFTSEPGTRCGSEGKAACRFVCGSGASDAHCPVGFGCGTDGICRAPTATFASEPVPTFATSAYALGAGDFDGDGRSELIAKGPRATTVAGLELGTGSRGFLRQRATFLSNGASFPAVGPLSSSGRSDLALVRALGFVSLWRGQPSGDLAPTFYTAFPITGDEFRLGAAEVLPGSIDALYYGHEVLVAVRQKDAFFLTYLQPPSIVTKALAKLPAAPSTFAGPQPTARLNETLPCDSQVLAYERAPAVAILPLCRTFKGSFVPNELLDGLEVSKQYVAPANVALPSGFTVGAGGVLVADFDLDGHLDLVIDGASGAGHTMLVAYGVGDGRFDADSWKGKPAPTAPSNAASVAPTIDCRGSGNRQHDFPLAVGQLTVGDDRVDAVFARGVCYRSANDERFLAVGIGVALKEAAIGDINANGIADVVAASSTAIEVLSGDGTFAHRFTVPTSARAGLIALGDVDGDLVNDIAYRDSPEGVESIVMMFGRLSGGPESPVTLGTITGNVQQILIASVNSNVGDNDDLADIGVVSKDAKADPENPYSVALLRGTTDRQLEAPFSIGDSSDTPGRSRHVDASVVTAGHFVAGPINALAAVAREPATGNSELWLVPMSEVAGTDPKRMKPSGDPLAGNFVWEHARAVAVDLDASTGDGIEELVLVAPSASIAQPNRLWVGRIPAGGDAFALKALDVDQNGAGTLQRPFEIVSADFDGDGLNDVAVRTEANGQSGVTLFFNDGAGGLVKGPPLKLGDEQPLAIATCALRVGKRSLIVAWSDKTVRSVTAGRQFAQNEEPLFEAASVRAMVGADVDGDGVDDLAIAQPGAIGVHYGAPAKP